MFDFRKAFFPTEEELEKERQLLDRAEKEDYAFWAGKGFAEQEIQKIRDVEVAERSELRSFQYHAGRRSLLENGIITVELVREILE